MRMTVPSSNDHVIRVPEGVDGWSENLFFFPFDYEQKVGAAMHLGRSGQDPHFWREFVYVFLPGGRAVVAKSFGHAFDSDAKNGANNLVYECLEPFKRWRASFDGMMRETSSAELFAGVLVERTWVRVQFELEYSALVDVPWQANTTPTAPGGAFSGTGSFHYEQVCTSTGTITVDGRSWSVNSRGFRDHTRGVRKFKARSGHTLLSYSTEQGAIGGFYQVRDLDGVPNFNGAYTVGTDGKPYDAEVLQAPKYSEVGRHVPEEFTAVLRDHEGREHTVIGQGIDSVPMTIVAPNDMFFGIAGEPDAYACTMSPANLVVDGVRGWGHLELSGLNHLVERG
jgi:hypothetical protein